MRRTAAAFVTLGLSLAISPAVPAQQAPVFRATTELVTVDVFVRAGSAVVPGLDAQHFRVLDNGVPQQVERLDAARVPLDVSLVVDVSGGSPNWWGTPRPGEEVAGTLADIVRQAQRVLHAGDRIRLLTIDTYTEEVIPFQRIDQPVSFISRVASGGKASLHDALIASLLEPVDPDRRHLVIAMTKAEDTMSTAEMGAVEEIARHSGAVLHIVLGTSLVGDTTCRDATPARDPGAKSAATGAAGSGTSGAATGGSGGEGASWVAHGETPNPVKTCRFPRRQFWQPAVRQVESRLPALAAVTGGAYYGFDALGLYRDFTGEVERIFHQYRQGYVLRYTPQGVRRDGWHEIEVSVPGHPEYTVQARRGYFVETPLPPDSRPAGSPRRPAASESTTLETLRQAFSRGEYREFESALGTVDDLEAFLREVRTTPTPWAASPRRDVVFALELAMAGLHRSDNDARAEATRLLEQHVALVRQPLGADAFECAWYWTAVAGLEGLIRPTLAASFVERAIVRCPAEPRLHLAAAVVADQRWPVGVVRALPDVTRQLVPSPDHRETVIRLYERAMAIPEISVEAGVRAAWFAYRVGDLDRALALVLAATGPVPDPQLIYLRELVAAQILRATGHHDEAAEGFRRALTAWPRAQSARVGLMAVELLRGNREEAAALAAAIETTPDADFDPWWRYWQGDFRAYGGIVARLRELAQ